MHPRVLTMIVCVPLLTALAVLALSTARAAPEPPAPGAAHAEPLGTWPAAGAGAVAGVVLAVVALRRAPEPGAATPR